MDHYKLIIYIAILTTAFYKADIKNIANLLTPLIMDTYDFEWGGRKFTQCKRREGRLNLVSYYNGSAKPERRISTARHKLSNILHKHEMTLNFEILSKS